MTGAPRVVLLSLLWLAVVASVLWQLESSWRPHARRHYRATVGRLPLVRKSVHDEAKARLTYFENRERVLAGLRNVGWVVSNQETLRDDDPDVHLSAIRDQIEGVLTQAGWKWDGPDGVEFLGDPNRWSVLTAQDFESVETMNAAYGRCREYLRRSLSVERSALF